MRPLVPDVAYLSYDAMPRDAQPAAYEVPLGAHTVAVEILSPDDLPRNVEHKIRTYLAAGSAAVFIADPGAASIVVHDCGGARRHHGAGMLRHPSSPGFGPDVARLFARARV